MLLAFILCQLSVLVAANPFHKFPFVFLLDVGNEELEKTTSEQIRLSIPGGSVALRYPAIGDGNTIGHLRVSSIDFGAAVKASIVDGGPGYKYAVLVLMGNPGVPYDVVVTVQTVNDPTSNIPNIGDVPNSGGDAVEVEEDANNSAEDMSDDSQINIEQSGKDADVQSSNAELMQSSVNVYQYAVNEEMEQSEKFDEDNNSNDNNDDLSDQEVEEEDDVQSERNINEADSENDQRDIHKEYKDDIDEIDDPDIQVKSIETEDEDDDEEISPELAQSVPEGNESAEDIRTSINTSNEDSRPYLSDGEVYYEEVKQQDTKPDYQQEPLDYEDPDEIQEIFNDGEIHSDDNKYRDSNNNNYIDTDDSYAVAY